MMWCPKKCEINPLSVKSLKLLTTSEKCESLKPYLPKTAAWSQNCQGRLIVFYEVLAALSDLLQHPRSHPRCPVAVDASATLLMLTKLPGVFHLVSRFSLRPKQRWAAWFWWRRAPIASLCPRDSDIFTRMCFFFIWNPVTGEAASFPWLSLSQTQNLLLFICDPNAPLKRMCMFCVL